MEPWRPLDRTIKLSYIFVLRMSSGFGFWSVGRCYEFAENFLTCVVRFARHRAPLRALELDLRRLSAAWRIPRPC